MSHSVRKHAWSDSNSNGLSISIQNKDVDIYVDNIYCMCVRVFNRRKILNGSQHKKDILLPH